MFFFLFDCHTFAPQASFVLSSQLIWLLFWVDYSLDRTALVLAFQLFDFIQIRNVFVHHFDSLMSLVKQFAQTFNPHLQFGNSIEFFINDIAFLLSYHLGFIYALCFGQAKVENAVEI